MAAKKTAKKTVKKVPARKKAVAKKPVKKPAVKKAVAKKPVRAKPKAPVNKDAWLPDDALNVMVNVITKPKPTLKKELPKAAFKKAFGLLGIYMAIIGFFLGLIVSVFSFAFAAAVPDIVPFLPILSFAWVWAPIFMVVIGWLGAIINNAIFYLFASLLGGKGTYEQQFYLMVIYSVPLGILSLLLAWVPFANLIIGIYAMYLITQVMKTAHKLTTGRAILVWLLPVLVVVGAIMLFAVLGVMMAMSAAPYYSY
jgi:hypothetical protein